MDARVGLWRRLSTEELMLLNCGVGEDSWSPLHCKEIQPVHSEGDLSWDFFGRNDAKAETPVLWPPHAKIWLIGKDSDAGRDWGQEEKGTTEDEMAGWHHWLDGREWVWVNCGSWWWTARPGVLRFMGSQSRTRLSDWIELNWSLKSFKTFVFLHTRSLQNSETYWYSYFHGNIVVCISSIQISSYNRIQLETIILSRLWIREHI